MKRSTFLLAVVVTLASLLAVTVPAPLHAYQAAAPIFLTNIPPGYRDWKLISVAHEERNLNSFAVVLGNDVAIKAYREGELPFPDGAIIAALHYGHVPSEENNKVLRELPYMKAWAAKYKDAGLVVIGVHAAEFGFEKDSANVKNAVSDLKIAYPIPIDSNHSIWSAFRNEYWPADYFIDRKGRIRYHHFGEGEYEKSERVIQELLRENGAASLNGSPVRITATGAEAPPSDDVQSPETYVGYARAENFASPERMARGSRKTYNPPAKPALNQWGLVGSWNAAAESGTLESAPGKIVFRFHSPTCIWSWARRRMGRQFASR
jgi:hypothetical protein